MNNKKVFIKVVNTDKMNKKQKIISFLNRNVNFVLFIYITLFLSIILLVIIGNYLK